MEQQKDSPNCRSVLQTAASSQHYEEGGWGWVVTAALFMTDLVIFGNIKALGVLAETITAEYDTELWITGWVVSMSYAVQLLMAPLLLPILRRFGSRPVMLLAGVMATAGYALAALTSSYFLEWSIFIIALAGTGCGCFTYPLIDILATYFKSYYPVALFLGTLGMSCGTLLYGPMTQVLLDTYGWRWAMMILAGLTFHLVPCAAVAKASTNEGDKRRYHSVPQVGESSADPTDSSVHNPQTKDGHCWKKLRESLDFAVLTDVHFVLVSVAACVVTFCFLGWAVYVVPHGIKQGLTPMQSSFLPTSFGVGNILGKLIATFLLYKDVLSARWIMGIGALLASVFFFVDPFMTSLAGLLLVTMTIGVGNAICTASKNVLVRNITTDDHLLSMYSWQAVLMGLANILSGLASGWFYDVTGSFKTTFIMFGAVQSLAVVCLLLDICIVKYRDEPQATP